MIESINGVHSSASRELSNDTVLRQMNKGISNWQLEKLGWRGFQELDWVENITNKYPEAVNIAHTCSSHTPGYLDQVQDLFDSAKSSADQKELHNYFVGKLGLEELSCRRSGAAGGLCDKKRAYMDICRLTGGIVQDK